VHYNPLHPASRLDTSRFEGDLRTPTLTTCLEWQAWGNLNDAAPAVTAAAATRTVSNKTGTTTGGTPSTAAGEPFRYDLVNTAREVLAQLSTPVLINFSKALNFSKAGPGTQESVERTSALFIALLGDLDRLLATDTAFMLGPWLQSARRLGGSATDCTDTRVAKLDARGGGCGDLMEWNARAQLTTWYPTLAAEQPTPGQQNGRDRDYAGKQWAGLISGIYIPRAELYRDQAIKDAAAGGAFNDTTATADYAHMTYEWQTDFDTVYPVEPVEDDVAVSIALREKWAPFFSSCA
jgi:alpha-N-acetylglucosaminidase